MVDIDAPLSWRMQQDGYLLQIDQLRAENAKLRELVDKLLYGLDHDVTPADALVWTQEVNTMLCELGVNDA